MSLSVCPVATIAAPVERVWALLVDPAGNGQWMDGTIDSVEPPGTARTGQIVTISTRAFGKRWRVTGAIDGVDDERRQIGVRVTSLAPGSTRNRAG